MTPQSATTPERDSATPPDGYSSIWLSLYRTAHTVGYLDADGYRTRYLEAGDASFPTVIMLHGTAGSIENFTANIADYARHFHVIAIDMVGCGWTDKPTGPLGVQDWARHVLAVMDVLGVRRSSIVGISLGSAVGAALAMQHPERVASLVMVAPVGVPHPDLQTVVDDVRARRLRAAGELNWASVRAIFQRLFLREERVIDDLIAVRLDIYRNPQMQQAMPFIVPNTAADVQMTDDAWRHLSVPILVVAAVDAPNMFLDNAYRIAELAPAAEVIEIGDCDHWAQFERPDQFNPRSIEFLKKVQP